jgi:pyridoxamine 5'-phosphate oxidase
MSLFQDISSNPLITLSIWLAEARLHQLTDPEAMTLSTVREDQTPSARTVLCKKIDLEQGIYFFTNYKSQKAGEIAKNPLVSAHFLWTPLARQVRIDGKAEKISREESEIYFATRPRESQIGAWASPQSEVMIDFQWLTSRVERYTLEFGRDKPVPCPPHWGGFLIKPTKIEFWEGKKGRLHDRVRLSREKNGEWIRQQIAP